MSHTNETSERGTVVRCDACGRTFVFTGAETQVSAYLGDGDMVDFCDDACFRLMLERGGALIDGRTISVIFGRTIAEHLAGVPPKLPEGLL